MNNKHLLMGAALSSLLVSGCASVVTGTDQNVTFNSEPDNATVTVSGKVIGKTPLSVQIDKGKHQSLTVSKEGFKTHTAQLSTTTSGWFWGNVICCGLLGSTTDGASGAMTEFSPDQYFITLIPANTYGLSTSKPRKIKELLVAFGSDFRLELTNGGGESSKALLDILEVNASETETTLIVLRKLSDQSANDLDLAKSIIDLYGIK